MASIGQVKWCGEWKGYRPRYYKVPNEYLKKNVNFGIIERIAHPEVPPRVAYQVASFGKKFIRVLDEIEK